MQERLKHCKRCFLARKKRAYWKPYELMITQQKKQYLTYWVKTVKVRPVKCYRTIRLGMTQQYVVALSLIYGYQNIKIIKIKAIHPGDTIYITAYLFH